MKNDKQYDKCTCDSSLYDLWKGVIFGLLTIVYHKLALRSRDGAETHLHAAPG